MQVIVNIPDEIYKKIQSDEFWLSCGLNLSDAYNSIKNGTPLPKGHGRLIDTDDIALIDEQFYVPSDYYVAESAINDAPTIIEVELATKTCNKQITSKLENAELARDSEETCNNKQVISKLVASEDAISREAVLSIIEESKEDDADEWMGYPWKVTPNLLMNEVRKLPPVHPIRPSVIEDIKAEIKSLYAYYGDGSGWEESRNITLNEVMRIIDKHTSGKEQA